MADQRELVPDRFLELVLYLVIHKRRRQRTWISSDLEYFCEFRRLYDFFEDSLSRFVAALKRRVHEYNIAYLIFYKFACLVYVIAFPFRVFVLFLLRFNLIFTRIFASLTLQI